MIIKLNGLPIGDIQMSDTPVAHRLDTPEAELYFKHEPILPVYTFLSRLQNFTGEIEVQPATYYNRVPVESAPVIEPVTVAPPIPPEDLPLPDLPPILHTPIVAEEELPQVPTPPTTPPPPPPLVVEEVAEEVVEEFIEEVEEVVMPGLSRGPKATPTVKEIVEDIKQQPSTKRLILNMEDVTTAFIEDDDTPPPQIPYTSHAMQAAVGMDQIMPLPKRDDPPSVANIPLQNIVPPVEEEPTEVVEELEIVSELPTTDTLPLLDIGATEEVAPPTPVEEVAPPIPVDEVEEVVPTIPVEETAPPIPVEEPTEVVEEEPSTPTGALDPEVEFEGVALNYNDKRLEPGEAPIPFGVTDLGLRTIREDRAARLK